MSGRLRVLVVDDHLVVREGLRLILDSGEGFEVVGEAADGAAAVREFKALRPDVVLMDLRMPGVDGLEAIERIRAEDAGAAIVVLTTFNEAELVQRALRAGARGYLLKDAPRDALLEAVRAAAKGDVLLRPEVMAQALGLGAAPRTASPAAASSSGSTPAGLTEREAEVLRAVARGERNKEIAERLGISERTVKAHLTSVFNKLGVDTRAAAVSAALRHGLIPAEAEDG